MAVRALQKVKQTNRQTCGDCFYVVKDILCLWCFMCKFCSKTLLFYYLGAGFWWIVGQCQGWEEFCRRDQVGLICPTSRFNKASLRQHGSGFIWQCRSKQCQSVQMKSFSSFSYSPCHSSPEISEHVFIPGSFALGQNKENKEFNS